MLVLKREWIDLTVSHSFIAALIRKFRLIASTYSYEKKALPLIAHNMAFPVATQCSLQNKHMVLMSLCVHGDVALCGRGMGSNQLHVAVMNFIEIHVPHHAAIKMQTA